MPMMRNIGIRPAFEEKIEKHEIERDEYADHDRFKIRNAIMYSLTRVSIGTQDDAMQNGIRNVVSSTNANEMPSTPTL